MTAASTAGDERDRGRLRARPAADVVPAVPAGTTSLAGGALLYVPRATADGRRSPLAVVFHGAGASARAGMRLLADIADQAGLVVLAPQSTGSTWDVITGGFGPDVEALDAALAEVFATCPVDPARVALSGFSDGASYALSLGVGNGDLVTRLIAFSPGFLAPLSQRGRPRIFITHGTDDEVLPIERCSRRIVPHLRTAGYDVTYEEFHGGHVVAAPLARRAVAWFTAAAPSAR